MRAKNVNEDFLDDVGIDKDKFIQSASVSAKKLHQIKQRCDGIIQATNTYFQQLDEEGIDPANDSDEMENYISNQAINDVATQILEIINNDES